jgi:Predicted transcriptional regulator with C-terminal CBS domains
MNDVTWEDVKRQRGLSSQASAEYAAAEYAFHLGLRVRQLRKERKWSQKELAERTGMSQPSVARFEAGGTTPTLAVLDRMARAFDMKLFIDITPHSVA